MDHTEHPEFCEDEEIGDLKNVFWAKALAAMIAHELAHTRFQDHSNEWKAYYRRLRVELVNPFWIEVDYVKGTNGIVEQYLHFRAPKLI